MNDYPEISVFMPVYNGEKYLRQSIDSVLNQTFENFELVCVDDSSSDKSFQILQEYEKKDARVIVLQKENGGNVPKSWNFVIPKLRGKFISYISQDDLMSQNNLYENYTRYLETGADIVIPKMIFYYEDNSLDSKLLGLGDKIISGEEAFELSLSWSIHGFTLCKAEIMKSESFNEDAYNSDEYITRKNYLLSRTVAFSNGIFYYRQNNPNAITRKFHPRFFEVLITDKMLECLTLNHFGINNHLVMNVRELRMDRIIESQTLLLKEKKQLSKTEYLKAKEMIRTHYRDIDKCNLFRNKTMNRRIYIKGYYIFFIMAYLSTWKNRLKNWR